MIHLILCVNDCYEAFCHWTHCVYGGYHLLNKVGGGLLPLVKNKNNTFDVSKRR